MKSLTLPTITLSISTIRYINNATHFFYLEPHKSNYRILTSYPQLAAIAELSGIGLSTIDSKPHISFTLPTEVVSIPINLTTSLQQVLEGMSEYEVKFDKPLLYVEDYEHGTRLTLGGPFSNSDNLSTYWYLED